MNTIREAYVHNDWARDKLLALADGCSDAELDRTFEMGLGSLRATLLHLWQAEQIWLDRWTATSPTLDPGESGVAISELRTRFETTAAGRQRFIDELPPDGGAKRASYTSLAGETITFALGDMLLHVANHGVQHRAQALNMVRHLGRKPPGLDYLFMRVERPTIMPDDAMRKIWTERGFEIATEPTPPVQFELDTLAEYFRYSDWANELVWKAAADLSDEQLDRPFEMGVGSLRKTLTHIRDAEQWWYNYWTDASQDKHKLPETTPIAELIGMARETRDLRERFIAACTPEQLQRPVRIEPMPETHLEFRLGESMMQLPGHGTHHRAQAVNMLRHLSADLPQLGYAMYARQKSAS